MRIHAAAVTALVLSATFAPLAQAETEQGWRVPVAYADLNLARTEDARIMAERLDEAARFACGGSPHFDANYRSARAAATRRFEECRAQAIDAALAQLDAPAVANALAERQGR